MNYFFYNTDARPKVIYEQPLPRYPILIKQNIAVLGGDRKKYGEQFNKLSPNDILLMYQNKIGVVAIGKVLEKWDNVIHKTPLYYTLKEMKGLDGGAYEYRIKVEWIHDLSESPISIDDLRFRIGYTPRRAVPRIQKHRKEIEKLIKDINAKPIYLLGEIDQPSNHIEGSICKVYVNTYERSQNAVKQCKSIHGTTCIICGFDFGSIYGAEFKNFIHIHHLKPLSEIQIDYEVNPETDLCPVCPNCHAVIHHGGCLRSISEVKELLNYNKKTNK